MTESDVCLTCGVEIPNGRMDCLSCIEELEELESRATD